MSFIDSIMKFMQIRIIWYSILALNLTNKNKKK